MEKNSDSVKTLLKTVYEECQKEDDAVRQRQIRQWRRLKLLWEGFQKVWYSETAHDWRIFDENAEDDDQANYDKEINVFKAYLESIIAALSVTVPPIKCYPDDAENTLDLATAKAGDKISQLIYRHNNAGLLWLHALFICVTEGMTACYTYPDSDEENGTYQEEQREDVSEEHETATCPSCGYELDDRVVAPGEPPLPDVPPQPMPTPDPNMGMDMGMEPPPEMGMEGQDVCPGCGQLSTPEVKRDTQIFSKVISITDKPKARICMEVYGGLYVKVPNYARNQKSCGYLILSEEIDYSQAVDEFEDIHGDKGILEDIKQRNPGSYTEYAQWGRLSPQYRGEYPTNVVTKHRAWIRPSRFNVLNDLDDVKKLKKLFPTGVKVTYVNEVFADAVEESLDKHWTLLENPLSDYVHFQPAGETLVSIQEITNDLISLTLQTIEHGIGQTFADPAVLNFNAYAQTEVTPGGVYPATPKSGKSLQEGFHEMKTATLSGEVLPFSQNIQSMGQLVSGALPSLFGGALEGSETASQYSMSRAQALQRQQNTWKMFVTWWKTIFSKVIPQQMAEIQEDERNVDKDADGNFVNVVIRKSELEGKIGRVELEANENLPITWGQRKDTIERILMNANPEVIKIIAAPENIPIIHEALGLPELFVPGEDDVICQYDELKQLLASEPIPNPDDVDGMMPELPSVEVDEIYDMHPIQFEIVRKWVISEAGRQAKTDNEAGYRNVLLHGMLHKLAIDKAMMEASMEQGGGAAPPKKPDSTETKEAPITGENDVKSV